MVELVDTQDLKSCDHCDRAGSIPAPGTSPGINPWVSQGLSPLSFLQFFKQSEILVRVRFPLRVIAQGLIPGFLMA